MADDSTLDYIVTLLEAVHKGNWVFNDTVASVVVATKAITLTTNGATLNQYATYCVFVTAGDNAGDEYTVVSCTNATPTVLTVSETIAADLAGDTIALYSGVTVGSFDSTPKLELISNPSNAKVLVYPGEYIGSNDHFYITRHLIKIAETSEANMMTALRNIIDGINKLNRRATITAYTRESTLLHCNFAYTNKPYKSTIGKWYIDLFLDFEWSTS